MDLGASLVSVLHPNVGQLGILQEKNQGRFFPEIGFLKVLGHAWSQQGTIEKLETAEKAELTHNIRRHGT